MPVIKCPVPNCQYQTEDVETSLVVALLNLHASTHTSQSSPTAPVEKVKRPTVKSARTSEDWTYFISRWTEYKEATNISGREAVIQLLECCEEQLRKDLSRNAGGSLTNKPEDEVLAAIKRLAVREENSMVARVQLHNMRQDRDETVWSFGARLGGQASVCKFTIECPSCKKGVDYTNAILRDVLTRGIADADIQLDLLSAENQDMSLEEAFKFIEAKEAGKRSASRLLDSHGAEAARSTYRTQQKASLAPRPDERCGYCGIVGHGRNAPPSVRKKACPAFQHSCKHCGRRSHFGDLCRSKDRPRRLPAHNTKTDQVNTTEDCEGAVFDALCSIQTLGQHKGRSSVVLDHHVYDNLCDRWLLQASRPQPFLGISVSVSQEDYQDLGFKLPRNTKPTTLLAMADTGCQSCLVGMKAVSRLGLRAEDLIPVSMKMHAANNNSIKILGAVILRFSGKSASGNHLESHY